MNGFLTYIVYIITIIKKIIRSLIISFQIYFAYIIQIL